jgi:hypothetical protein
VGTRAELGVIPPLVLLRGLETAFAPLETAFTPLITGSVTAFLSVPLAGVAFFLASGSEGVGKSRLLCAGRVPEPGGGEDTAEARPLRAAAFRPLEPEAAVDLRGDATSVLLVPVRRRFVLAVGLRWEERALRGLVTLAADLTVTRPFFPPLVT